MSTKNSHVTTKATIALRKETKAKLDKYRYPGQCYDGFLCQLIELWEKIHSVETFTDDEMRNIEDKVVGVK